MTKASETIFAEIEVHGFTVRPWSAMRFMKVAPYFGSVAEYAEQAGVSLFDIWDNLFEDGKEKEAMAGLKIGAQAMPLLIPVMAITLGEDESIFEDMPLNQFKDLVWASFELNRDEIKNCFPPVKKPGRKKKTASRSKSKP